MYDLTIRGRILRNTIWEIADQLLSLIIGSSFTGVDSSDSSPAQNCYTLFVFSVSATASKKSCFGRHIKGKQYMNKRKWNDAEYHISI